jgi:hypothetical protein
MTTGELPSNGTATNTLEAQPQTNPAHATGEPPVDPAFAEPTPERSGWVDMPGEQQGAPQSVNAGAPVVDTGAPVEATAGREAQVGREPERREGSDEGALFAEGEASGLRGQWTEVQAGFVDDPKQCVHQADSLVSEVVERLTANLAQARARLEEQWASGEEASTEDLRVALKRYREFFDRLLAA